MVHEAEMSTFSFLLALLLVALHVLLISKVSQAGLTRRAIFEKWGCWCPEDLRLETGDGSLNPFLRSIQLN